MRDIPSEGPHNNSDYFQLFGDFETFYSQTYSLTKMDPASYILDQLFEGICLGIASPVGDPMLIDGPLIPTFINSLKARKKPIYFISHNAQFDVAILTWRYGLKPDLIIDTIALSRTLLGPKLRSHSLESVADYFGLPPKGDALKDVKGMTRADIIASGLWEKFTKYCMHDAWLCREIYNRLMPLMPNDEIILHDILTRCTTEPSLRVSRGLLEDHLNTIMQEKANTLAQVEAMGIGKSHLMSNPKFADVLRNLGVEPPMKISPTTNEKTFAFARTDEGFTDLLEHPNVMVRTVVEARLETKSTIEETRTRRFIAISNLEFPNLGSCFIPMPVVIGAAHTHRVGGGWDLNVQNLGRGSRLRDAIYVEDEFLLLVVDAKQIEARMTAWFCGETELLESFRRGEDVYANFGTEIFNRLITKADVIERFVGKTGILQLGYASGWLKFQNTVRVLSAKSGTPIMLSDEQALEVVNKYRAKYHRTKATWRTLDNVLMNMHGMPNYGEGPGHQMKCVTFYKHMMMGPTGLPIHFPNLQFRNDQDDQFGSWWFDDGRFKRRTYGASLLETISQHVSRCIVMGAAVRLRQPMATIGAKLVHTAHDELVFRVPREHIDTAKEWARIEMNRSPDYAPDLPLDCDIGVARRYGDAK